MNDYKFIKFETIASNKVIRKWVVDELRYDFDYEGYTPLKLPKGYIAEFGTPYGAIKHAVNIYNHYIKHINSSDLQVIIKEVIIDNII